MLIKTQKSITYINGVLEDVKAEKKIGLFPEIDNSIIGALLSSSLFYWNYIAYTDCRNLQKSFIDAFKIPASVVEDKQLIIEGKKLFKDYEKKKYTKSTHYKTTGNDVIYDEYYPKKSKLIIDEIDKLLKKHYGFTEEELDFIIVPTTHLHMDGFTLDGSEQAEERAALWISRFDALLDADLPFHKVGVAHLTCGLIWRNRYLEVLEKIPDAEYHRLFERAAKCGIGIELNFPALHMDERCAELTLKPYRIAREEGCRFYLGSDAHTPAELAKAKANFEAIIDLLGLTEDDKIPLLTGGVS